MVRRLKELRNGRGISQQALAEKLGVSQQSINKYENHDIEPDIATLIAMADYFSVTVDYLIGRNAENTSAPSTTEQNLLADFRLLNAQEQGHFSGLLRSLAGYKR